MDLLAGKAARARFEAYVKDLASVIGHTDRVVPLLSTDQDLLRAGRPDRKLAGCVWASSW